MPLLSVEDISVSFSGLRGPVEVLDGVSFQVEPGEIVALVGESGSGKSVTSLAVMGLLERNGSVTKGRITFDGNDVAMLTPAQQRDMRGREMSMIFQEPGTSLNPVFRVGFQIAEALTEHGMRRPEAAAAAVDLMERVGIPDAAERTRNYPHQFSGGMKQRIMIAMALACRPRLLIADEPTTALDVTIQAQILNLILDIREEFGMATLLITHDMGVVAQMADRVVVMYAGQVVETAPAERIFTAAAHPYTRLLLRSMPSARVRQEVLPVIEGTTPPANAFPSGCRFHLRCPIATEVCKSGEVPFDEVGPGQSARCHRLDLPAEDLMRAIGAA